MKPQPLPLPTCTPVATGELPYTTSSSRWRAVSSRDPYATSSFTYGVNTTGVYCRPTCPARMARRANVSFYDSAAAAEDAGFRACKRCRPEVHGQWDPARDMVERACKIVAEKRRNGEAVVLEDVASMVGVTRSHFCRVFKKVMGRSLGEWERRGGVRAVEGGTVDGEVVAVADDTPSTDDSHGAATPRSESGLDWNAFVDFEWIETAFAQDTRDGGIGSVIFKVFDGGVEVNECEISASTL